ncbi:aminoglycoside phosphotransferase family protein [Tritonibacter horizontis]|uniref:Phosphotransferase enzyme family protein n=1 Tax=Tritonibacter horizontis TaxID=1768241 RepID=A0A132C464_9RHOB|nr:phosphotransferase [Tritonibacter horizontis]KUP94797.1 phosphotransferase enzyme family protein [Tritonibacter horizontis]
MTSRAAEIAHFLDANGLRTWESQPLAGDASVRRYHRLTSSAGETRILMDWPPDTGGDIGPFVSLANYLLDIGVSAPGHIAQDPERGLLLIEDLGDAVFARVMETDPQLEQTLYAAATDLLIHLHRRRPPDLPVLTPEILSEMTSLVFSEYRNAISGDPADDHFSQFTSRFTDLLTDCLSGDMVFVHRDFHAENLLWLPMRQGVARVGVIDFQDAKVGHRAYDLVSLLQDARRDVPTTIEADVIAHYIAATGVDADRFHKAYAVIGVQRNLRILGVFARLSRDFGKSQYIDLIPRVWAHVERGLSHPALSPVAKDLLQILPAPTAVALERLRK